MDIWIIVLGLITYFIIGWNVYKSKVDKFWADPQTSLIAAPSFLFQTFLWPIRIIFDAFCLIAQGIFYLFLVAQDKIDDLMYRKFKSD